MRKTYTINDLPPEERPRERLANLGPQALSIYELIAIILGRGIPGESVIKTSQELISRFGSLAGLHSASLEEIQKIKGLGLAKACQIKAALELARRLEKNPIPIAVKSPRSTISPSQIYSLIRKKISHYAKEHFIVISLDTKSKVLGVDKISVGTLTASLVHPRETLEAAIRRHAASFIIAHNHPSGDPEPFR
jgi:DNA repair protein RadC